MDSKEAKESNQDTRESVSGPRRARDSRIHIIPAITQS
jgi:hypothetical protein